MKTPFLISTALALTLGSAALAEAPSPKAVLETYADIAAAKFDDSLITAKALQAAVDALIAAPSEATLQAAKDAWLAARPSYQQTEVYRFGNPIVDEWEGKVNAWPLDEGLIDYVDTSSYGESEENDYAALNVVATPVFTLSGTEVDATDITPELLENTLHEADGIDTNVATGYHAIEFMLWGQDLNGHAPGAGNRPWTDYLQGDGCTHGNCDRRAAYLKAATDLLVSDLEYMAAQWATGGDARNDVLADETAGLTAMLTGMGSLSYGEQAGERMRLGLMLNDPEEEHDCFSDNTHNSHYYDGMGIRNAYLGQYTRVDGTVVSGASLSDLVAAKDPALDSEVRAKLDATMDALGALKEAADNGFAYDQMLERGSVRGEELIMTGVNGLIDQAKSFERVVSAFGLNGVAVEGSDSLDNPSSVFE
ncbi:imelysin family protein [Thalassovita aquimarina]|uniref:Peptidase n=1 Tax=Thalassovita aquimarina TaxID=2785917 RepID=A0ABS5HKS2_9RHOB|nr:imelysin family protein [Thalassovita aquimarina]MBR9649592.1 peptidase [Thalassovita aquimarina]